MPAVVVWFDERFWINPADPHWKHVAPVKWLLALHGLAGLRTGFGVPVRLGCQAAAGPGGGR